MKTCQKGAVFERLVCKMLSKWISRRKRDDIFWRTSGSGGRATTRKKQNIDTVNSHGDVMALDPIGNALLDKYSIEIKRGYSRENPLDMIIHPAKKTGFMEIMNQCRRDSKAADREFFLLIWKADHKPAVLMSNDLSLLTYTPARIFTIEFNDPKKQDCFGILFDDFLKTNPKSVCGI